MDNETVINAQNNEIDLFFKQHWQNYCSQCEQSRSNIDAWRNEMIASTNQHADEQIRLLDEDRNYEFNQWKRKYADTCETVRACVEAQDFNLLAEVRQQCQNLDYQVTQLEFIKSELQLPKVVTVREQEGRASQKKTDSNQQSTPSAEELLVNPPRKVSEPPTSQLTASTQTEP